MAECIARGATRCLFVPPTTTTTLPPQCYADADCQDANLCNGLEACVAGTCVPGNAALCSDGVPALWLGTATSASGGYVNIGATLCAVGTTLTGQFACEPGTNSCLATQGTITGTIVGADAFYPIVTFPDGSYCNFGGQVSGLTLSGTYTCYDPSGFIVYDQGTYSLARCPSTTTSSTTTTTTTTAPPPTTAPTTSTTLPPDITGTWYFQGSVYSDTCGGGAPASVSSTIIIYTDGSGYVGSLAINPSRTIEGNGSWSVVTYYYVLNSVCDYAYGVTTNPTCPGAGLAVGVACADGSTCSTLYCGTLSR